VFRDLGVSSVDRAGVVAGGHAGVGVPENVEWWTPDDVARGMDPAYAVRVLDALRENADPAVRTHDGVHLIPHE
jgi:hypothetical protein